MFCAAGRRHCNHTVQVLQSQAELPDKCGVAAFTAEGPVVINGERWCSFVYLYFGDAYAGGRPPNLLSFVFFFFLTEARLSQY